MRKFIAFLILIILILVLAWFIWNFARPTPPDVVQPEPAMEEIEIPPEVKAALSDFKTQHKNATVRWNRITGTPKMIYNFEAGPYPGSVEDQGNKFLSEWTKLFQLKPRLSDLILVKSEPGLITKPVGEEQRKVERPVLHYLYYNQRFERFEVYGAQLILYLTNQGKVVTVHNNYFPDIKLKNSYEIRQKDALAAAENALKGEEKYGQHSEATLVIFPKSGNFYYAWDVRLKGWQLMIDAEDKKVLLKQKRIMEQATGTGMVYTENCDTTPTRQWRNLTELDGTGNLTGTFYRVDPCSSSDSAAFNAGLSYNYNVDDQRFDQVMVYYFLEEARRYLFGLGFNNLYPGGTTSPPVRTAYTNCSFKCNAFYDPDSIEFRFGRGGNLSGCGYDINCNSSAHDGNVIIHEYGHFAIDQVSGIDYSNQGAAIHEGTSDYFSSSYSDNPCMGECFDKDHSCSRDLTNTLHYPEDMEGESHADGRIWGGALWDAREMVGENWIDDVIFAGLQGLPFHPTFTDYAHNIYLNSLVKAQDVFDLSNFIEAFLAGLIQLGIHDAFCSRGIVVPYGDYVTQTKSVSNCWWGETKDWDIYVPSGHTVTGWGCGNTRDYPSDRWQGYDEVIMKWKNVDSHQVTVHNNRIHIRVKLEWAFACANKGEFQATYYVYYE